MIAFVDESVRETGLGVYVVGAVVAPSNECADLRTRLLKGGRRFHFYKAGETRRLGMLAMIGKCRLLTSAYVYRGLYPIGQEGARALCLARLLRDLRAWEVDELVMESRRIEADVRDRVTILSALTAKRAPDNLAYRWESPDDDPMLWLADAVAGAVRANVGTDRYATPLEKLGTAIRHVM